MQLLCEGKEKGTDLFLASVTECQCGFQETWGCSAQLHPLWRLCCCWVGWEG